MPKSVRIGDLFFPTTKIAGHHFGATLSKYEPGDRVSPIDAALLEELLARHPHRNEKIGVGVDHFTVVSHPEFRHSKCFAIVRKDGSVETFSYMTCVNGRERVSSRPSVQEMFAD